MYHEIEDQEKHPEKYFLKKVDPGTVEDECFDFLSKPRPTQKTVGYYLKKLKGADDSPLEKELQDDKCRKKRFGFPGGSYVLEKVMHLNKGFWVDRPELVAPLINKLREKYTVDIEKKTKREQGIFFRPKFIELEYLKKMAKAGLLYPEEFSDSEEEVQPEETSCEPFRKVRYQICDPCKEKKVKKEKPKPEPPKDLIEDMKRRGLKPPFEKIPSGCQCDYYGDHNICPTTWDSPFEDGIDMLRQHEMNKVLKPYKMELLNKNYEINPPVKFMAHESSMKKTFPVYQISNLAYIAPYLEEGATQFCKTEKREMRKKSCKKIEGSLGDK